ncbi:unnamed protein product [Discula destructiva]
MSITSASSATTTSYNLGPLTTTYSPSGASCTTIYQRLENGGLEYGTINTAPETSSCLPTKYNPYGGFYYSPGVCPLGYTIGCTAAIAGNGLSATAATCCPSGGYSCRLTRIDSDPVACESTILDYVTMYVEAYSWISTTFSSTSVTTVVSPGNVVFAEAIIVRRGDKDPTWSGYGSSTAASTSSSTVGKTVAAASESASTSTSTSTGTSSPAAVSLSVPAKIGVGIGVGLGALMLSCAIAAAFIIMRRRRRRAAKLAAIENLPSKHLLPMQGTSELHANTRPYELPSKNSPQEMDGQGQRVEMHSSSLPAELMGTGTYQQQ